MSVLPRLRDLSFVDLYLGVSYADLKADPGAHAARSPVPEQLNAEVVQVRELCARMFEGHGEPEFALPHDDVLYRVTVMQDLRAQPVYFLRRMAASLRELSRLGLPSEILNFLMQPTTRGLILFAGDMAAGKTSSAASLLSARLQQHGGLALAIEDPPETQLDGLHGQGRCIQVPALRRHGHYREQLRRAMRTGVSTLLIGEIRCQDTASEAIRQSINGLTVISTIHSKDPVDAITRLIAFASSDMTNPAEILASGLSAVIHQKIERVSGGGVRLQFRGLQIHGADESGIRTKIREGRIEQLGQDIASQAGRQTWK
ncbi:MAG: ATPase, T2SS/T4P/T4SS family [Luteimonas sp.]